MKILADFKKFVIRGNFVDMAIGFTVGAAFTTVVKSAVEDLVMPPIGLLLGNVDFTQKFWVIRAGKDGVDTFQTIAQAKAAGAITFNYGNFINNVFALLLVAVFMFLVIKVMKRIEDEMEEQAGGEKKVAEEPDHKKCPFCLTTIVYKAVRCPQCTTELEGFRARRDKPGVALHELGASSGEGA